MKKNKASLRFDNVTKIFGKNTIAVDRLSVTMEAGQLVTLLGPSGCGKTTVLRMIAGLEMPSSGSIYLGENNITTLPASDRDISMVFQSYALFPHMSVIKNVAYGLKFSGFPTSEIKERAINGLKLVGLEPFADRLPSQLSGGQQQRVAVARALVLEPEVLLFDEPLSNLDAKLRRSVREEIRELQQKLNLTVVYVTHDQEEALAVSDHIIVMKNARLAQQGSPQIIYQNPTDSFVADFIGEANLIETEIVKLDKGKAQVRLGESSFTVTISPQLANSYDSGKNYKLAIRPSFLQIKSSLKKKTLSPNTFMGKVLKAIYLGIRMEYTIKTDFGNIFVTSQDLKNPAKVGSQVEIYCDPSQANLVEETA